MRALALPLLLAGAVLAQDPAAKTAPGGDAKAPAPLPEGQTRPLQAVVMKVEGSAQWRPGGDGAFRDCKVNDLLDPGAEVRTGRKSAVTLRVGMNATVLVDRQSRVVLPRVLQDGQVLRTTVGLAFGQTDVKVDRIGLETDFEVVTPTATLAVSGTLLRVSWDAVAGFSFQGAPGNRIGAAEAEYWNSIVAELGKDDASDEETKLPVFHALGDTFFLPPPGAFTPEEAEFFVRQIARHRPRFFKEHGVQIAHFLRGGGGQRGQQGPASGFDQPGFLPPPRGPGP